MLMYQMAEEKSNLKKVHTNSISVNCLYYYATVWDSKHISMNRTHVISTVSDVICERIMYGYIQFNSSFKHIKYNQGTN